MTPSQLAQSSSLYNTDKFTETHRYEGFYDVEFPPRKESAANVLEIGVAFGDSVRLWHDYFENATIHGIEKTNTTAGRKKGLPMNTVTTQTPLRLTLGGGGTDLPAYCNLFGGFVVAAAITKYVKITLGRRDDGMICLEPAWLPLSGPMLDATMRALSWSSGLDVNIATDVRPGSGLGGSGAFLVGLVNAILALQDRSWPPHKVAEKAFVIESQRVGRSVGRQDHYVAVYGGVVALECLRSGTVDVSQCSVVGGPRKLEAQLLLFSLGDNRDASGVLGREQAAIADQDASVLASMHKIKQIGREVVTSGCCPDLMREHWEFKQSLSVTTPASESCVRVGCNNGASAGKLVGAGGGGHVLFYCELDNQPQLRRVMEAASLLEVSFEFSWEGSRVL